jgi:hypothetical protein
MDRHNIWYLGHCSQCMQTKIAKIKRPDCLEAYSNFPQADYEKEVFFYPKAICSYTLILYSKSARGHAKNLSVELSKLIGTMGMDRLIFLGDAKRAWRYQDNPYPAVQQAMAYLEENGVGKRFDGGLEVGIDRLPVFLMHFFWLVRCNAALPYFHLWIPVSALSDISLNMGIYILAFLRPHWILFSGKRSVRPNLLTSVMNVCTALFLVQPGFRVGKLLLNN